MPFGQAFWLSRIIGAAVEGATGDKELARNVRVGFRWGLAFLTIDPKGFLADSVVDGLAEGAADHAFDTVGDHAIDTAVEHVSSGAHEHMLSAAAHFAQPHFGEHITQALHASPFVQSLLNDPLRAVARVRQSLEDHEINLPQAVAQRIMALRPNDAEGARKALEFLAAQVKDPTTVRAVTSIVRFGRSLS